MNKRWRLVIYVLLNILISAAVTGGMLYYYHRTYPLRCGGFLTEATSALDDKYVKILSIRGAGAVEDEVVTIQNSEEEAVTLTDWMLKDSQGNMFTFPQLTLHPDASIRVHTKAGENTASDLYWGRSEPAWEPGELVGLYDPQGIVRAFYRVP